MELVQNYLILSYIAVLVLIVGDYCTTNEYNWKNRVGLLIIAPIFGIYFIPALLMAITSTVFEFLFGNLDRS